MLNSGACIMIVHYMTVYMNITQREIGACKHFGNASSLKDGDDTLDSEGSSFNDMPRVTMVARSSCCSSFGLFRAKILPTSWFPRYLIIF